MEILFPGKPRPKIIYGLKVGTDIGFLPTSPGKMAEFIVGVPFFRKYGVIFANKPSQAPEHFENEWYYQDPQGQVQGPFSSEDMRNWLDNNYFKPDLRVRQGNMDQTPFVPLIQLYPDLRQAFEGRPMYSAPQRQQVDPRQPSEVVHPETPTDAEFTWDHCALIG